MVQINRLRLSGFKSFVEKTEVDIGQGLNGVVGPNGCGKSNLVEALRWVMGETSAKRMRGGEMEDVIFAGTSQRPARAIAEVTVTLDNTDGKAPIQFGNATELEITRRIERDKGSKYLVNGKEVRARDVQTLFADALTGAHSPALVSQGKVTSLIQSKPTERRQMLEESAGVASLYTRRHEAELRLKAADENLGRLDLVLNELQNRGDSLRSQAKQALKYRDLSDTIRRLEMVLAWGEWGSTRDKLRKEETRFAETDKALGENMLQSAELARLSAEATTALEDIRKEDIEARAALQLLRQSAEQLERETARRRSEHADLVRQIAEGENDHTMAAEQRTALTDRQGVIEADLKKMEDERTNNPERLAALEVSLGEAQEAARAAENALFVVQGKIRDRESQIAAASRRIEDLNAEQARVEAKLVNLESQFNQLNADSEDERLLIESRDAYTKLKGDRQATEDDIEKANARLTAARERVSEAQDNVTALRQQKTMQEREVRALNQLAEQLSEGVEDSLLLSLDVPEELAVPLARAAGDIASRAKQKNWNAGGNVFAPTDWPSGVTRMADRITAPEALQSFLSSIGIIDHADQSIISQLKPGQTLVSADGRLWRWDGLVTEAAGQQDNAARALQLRQQVKAIGEVLEALDPQITQAEQDANDAITAKTEAATDVNALQQFLRNLIQRFEETEQTIERLRKNVGERTVKLGLIVGQRDETATQLTGIKGRQTEALTDLNRLEADAADTDPALALESAEQALTTARKNRDDISQEYESLRAAEAQYKQMEDTLRRELARTLEQFSKLGSHADNLGRRLTNLRERKATLHEQIVADERGTQHQDILDKIATAETTSHAAADTFATAEAKAKILASDLKTVETAHIELREKRAIVQTTVTALKEEQVRIAAEIEERFTSSPSALEAAIMAEWPEGVPGIAKARSERDFLFRERDDMGPVNLRAEVELTEAETEHARLTAEKTELVTAIERLREGIDKLNVEARERILKTFAEANTHFQSLFKRLFGGGEAHLKLIDSEDPLEAGLEIFAQPPGKALQSLSLLSGGEQTLTALAMIFAMFLSNPAPVCVLDEVDAPLDDANVDRVCTLLEEMANNCATRFLVITHHRMTMARMDRLYGVTMAERGVSQLVSVNLATQGELLPQAKVA